MALLCQNGRWPGCVSQINIYRDQKTLIFGWIFLWFYVCGHPKAQPVVDLVLKHLRRWDNGLNFHPITRHAGPVCYTVITCLFVV